jgi:hypothetical protein
MTTLTKSGLISLVAVAAVAAAPQSASAHTAKKAHKHATASRSSAVDVAPVSSTEARFRQMEAEIQALRSELNRTRTETKSAVNNVAEKTAAQDAAIQQDLEAHKKEKKNMVFFRGGYANMVNSRANQVFSDLYAYDNGFVPNGSRDGAYFGAGLDYSISDDLFGLMDGTEFMGEVMFDWKRWESQTSLTNGSLAVVPVAANALGVNNAGRHLRGVTLSQFTLSASPKIKFLKGSPFRPWIIPVGMTFNVISPPSDAGTVLAPGAMFGIGFDYNVWNNIYLGLDGRYNLVAHELDGVKADHYMIGGYVGFGF